MSLSPIRAITVGIALLCAFHVQKGSADFRDVGLQLYNQYRRLHQAGNLVMDRTLNQNADSCARMYANMAKYDPHSCRLIDEADKKRNADNLYMSAQIGMSDEEAVRDAIKKWYEENTLFKKNWYQNPQYDFKQNDEASKARNKMVGHFVAMVWKGCQRFGISVARSTQNKRLVVLAVCSPFRGTWSQNVYPAQRLQKPQRPQRPQQPQRPTRPLGAQFGSNGAHSPNLVNLRQKAYSPFA